MSLDGVMAAGLLSIRNLTSTPIGLKLIERFSPEEGSRGNSRTLATNFSRLLANVTRTNNIEGDLPNSNEIPFGQEQVDVRIEPFATISTQIRVFLYSDKERLGLTIEVEGEKHQVQIPVTTLESATMRPLDEIARFRLVGIYITRESYLAVFSAANLNAWMRELGDDLLLSALSIPGTHNSPACHVAAPSVRCQAVSPREQLENGARFLDIRVQPQYPDDPTRDELLLVHGAFPISLTGSNYFRELLLELDEFLECNPSEAVIISLKREGTGRSTDEQLGRILCEHYAHPHSRWYTAPKIPTLGEVRGKIVLLRRFDIPEGLKQDHDGRGWAIDASGWADNAPNATCTNGDICIQDFYEILQPQNIGKKIQFVMEHIERASANRYPLSVLNSPDSDKHYPFYINFLSASNFWSVKTWPEEVAAKVNPATVDYLCRKHDGEDGDWSTGILVTDWVGQDGDWDLMRCIVGMNAKLKMR